MKFEVRKIDGDALPNNDAQVVADWAELLLVAEEAGSYHSGNLEVRTLEYAGRAINLYRHLIKQEPAAKRLANQFLNAATSVGANVAEAQGAESRRDFAHKHAVARKEARESLYWLKLFRKSDFVPADRIDALIDETDELVAILTVLVRRLKTG